MMPIDPKYAIRIAVLVVGTLLCIMLFLAGCYFKQGWTMGFFSAATVTLVIAILKNSQPPK